MEYTVYLRAYAYATVKVEADSLDEATDKALDKVRSDDWDIDSRREVLEVCRRLPGLS